MSLAALLPPLSAFLQLHCLQTAALSSARFTPFGVGADADSADKFIGGAVSAAICAALMLVLILSIVWLELLIVWRELLCDLLLGLQGLTA